RLPPLRERKGDLPLLAAHLRDKIARRLNVQGPGAAAWQGGGIVDSIVRAAHAYAWPGNIRELENLIERAMVFHDSHREGSGAVLDELRSIAPELFSAPGGLAEHGEPQHGKLRASRDVAESERIRAVLAECGGNRDKAATVLGISRTTLWRKLKLMDQQASARFPRTNKQPAAQ